MDPETNNGCDSCQFCAWLQTRIRNLASDAVGGSTEQLKIDDVASDADGSTAEEQKIDDVASDADGSTTEPQIIGVLHGMQAQLQMIIQQQQVLISMCQESCSTTDDSIPDVQSHEDMQNRVDHVGSADVPDSGVSPTDVSVTENVPDEVEAMNVEDHDYLIEDDEDHDSLIEDDEEYYVIST